MRHICGVRKVGQWESSKRTKCGTNSSGQNLTESCGRSIQTSSGRSSKRAKYGTSGGHLLLSQDAPPTLRVHLHVYHLYIALCVVCNLACNAFQNVKLDLLGVLGAVQCTMVPTHDWCTWSACPLTCSVVHSILEVKFRTDGQIGSCGLGWVGLVGGLAQ